MSKFNFKYIVVFIILFSAVFFGFVKLRGKSNLSAAHNSNLQSLFMEKGEFNIASADKYIKRQMKLNKNKKNIIHQLKNLITMQDINDDKFKYILDTYTFLSPPSGASHILSIYESNQYTDKIKNVALLGAAMDLLNKPKNKTPSTEKNRQRLTTALHAELSKNISDSETTIKLISISSYVVPVDTFISFISEHSIVTRLKKNQSFVSSVLTVALRDNSALNKLKPIIKQLNPELTSKTLVAYILSMPNLSSISKDNLRTLANILLTSDRNTKMGNVMDTTIIFKAKMKVDEALGVSHSKSFTKHFMNDLTDGEQYRVIATSPKPFWARLSPNDLAIIKKKVATRSNDPKIEYFRRIAKMRLW